MQSGKLRFAAALLAASTALVWAAGHTAASGVVQPPDTVRIDALSETYGPVYFDHALHDSYASCAECHHHVTSEPPSDPQCLSCHDRGRALQRVGCGECHPADRYAPAGGQADRREPLYHDDVPGLIGAYHLNCISCHQVVGAGPVGCRECHEKR